MWWQFVLPFLVSFFVAALLTPLSAYFAKRLGLVDDPARHRHPAIIHTKPIPRAGGVPLFSAIVIGALFFLPLTQPFLSILVSGAIVVAVGLLDDKYDLSPYVRFLLNIVSAAIVVLGGIVIPFTTNPLGGILHFSTLQLLNVNVSVASILAIFWIVWTMNMLNWSKGVDGQMPGIAAISAGIIGIASLRFQTLAPLNIATSELSFLVAGASCGFLLYNFYPAKIFPGYSGTILGFMIGVLSILSSVKLATALLVMGVPTADAVFTIIRRILSKKSPFWHDKGHLHHLLLDLGFSQRTIALFYWFMSLMLGIISLGLSSRGKLFAIILVIAFVGAVILSIRFITTVVEKEELDD